MPEKGGEGGSVPVLEAIIVSALLVSAIAFVVTWDTPLSADEGSRTVLAQKARDAMLILQETPVQGKVGDTLLSAYVATCLQGDCSQLQKKLDKLLPQGTSYALYVSNGRDLIPIYEPASPTGPSITARVTMEPKWSSTFLSAAVPKVNPTGDPVVLVGLPIYNSNALTSDGTPVIVTMEGTRVSDGAKYVVQAAISTTATAASQGTPAKAASLTFVDADGDPIALTDGRGTTLTVGKTPSGAALPLRLRVAETGGVAIPAGATVTVALPPGWTGAAPAAANAAHWTIVADATDPDGSSIVAQLTHEVESAYADLLIEATYAGDANDYYAFRADLSQGASAHASLLVRGDEKTGSATYEVPTLMMSAPRPLGVGSPTTWTLAAHMPAAIPTLSAEAVVVDRVTVRADDGTPLFGSVTDLSGGIGSWQVVGGALEWTGPGSMTHEFPFTLVFNATGLAVSKTVSDRGAYTPEVALDSTLTHLHDETSPGLHRVTVPPGARGYDSSVGAWLEANHTAVATEPYRATELPGTANYSVGYFAPLQDALFGCVAQVGARNVGAGTTQTVHVNVQPVMYTLAALGYAPSVTLNVYPPWSGDDRTPIITRVLPSPGVLDPSNLDPDVGLYDVELEIPAATLYGAYVVEAEVAWNEEVTKDLGSGPVTALFQRTARVYDYYLVTPPSLLTPPTPLYDVHLVAWMDDWR